MISCLQIQAALYLIHPAALIRCQMLDALGEQTIGQLGLERGKSKLYSQYDEYINSSFTETIAQVLMFSASAFTFDSWRFAYALKQGRTNHSTSKARFIRAKVARLFLGTSKKYLPYSTMLGPKGLLYAWVGWLLNSSCITLLSHVLAIWEFELYIWGIQIITSTDFQPQLSYLLCSAWVVFPARNLWVIWVEGTRTLVVRSRRAVPAIRHYTCYLWDSHS